MDPKDDTVVQSLQAQEDVYFALIEAGEIPGVLNRKISTPEDLEQVLREGKALAENSFVILRVPRQVVEFGFFGGVTFFEKVFADLTCNAQGLALAFDGWADDGREYHEIPEFVDFCRGLLIGPAVENVAKADPHIRKVLSILIDEIKLAGVQPDGTLDNPEALELMGGSFLIAHAFPERLIQGEGDTLTLDLTGVMAFRANVFRDH